MRCNFWINFAFFQLAWPACVLAAAYDQIWIAVLWVGLFAAWQLHPDRAHPSDWLLAGLFMVVGVVLDTIWIQTGLLSYSAAWPWSGTTPIWLLMLWLALALSVNHSLAFFRQHWIGWMLILCMASPFSYWMASRLGAVEWLAEPWMVILALGPGWALVVGLMFALADALHRQQKNTQRDMVRLSTGISNK